MSQPASLWIRSNRLCPHPDNISGTNTIKRICIYFNKTWSFLCCCLFNNTWNKCLYSLSASEQPTSSSVEGAAWPHVASTLFEHWGLYLEAPAIRLSLLELKPSCGSTALSFMTMFLCLILATPTILPACHSVMVFLFSSFSHSGHGSILLIPSAKVPLHSMTLIQVFTILHLY